MSCCLLVINHNHRVGTEEGEQTYGFEYDLVDLATLKLPSAKIVAEDVGYNI